MSTRNSRTATVPPGPDARQTTRYDGRRLDAPPTRVPQGPPPGGRAPESGRRRLTPLVWLAATMAVILVVAIVAGVISTGQDGTTTDGTVVTIVDPTVGSQEYLDRLANQGYIPPEAVDRDLLRLERLVGRGEIPPESLGSRDTDQRLEELANGGRIPSEAAR